MRVCCAAMLVGGVLEWRKVREYAEATAYSVAQAFICITYTFAPESVETRLRAPFIPKEKFRGRDPGASPGPRVGKRGILCYGTLLLLLVSCTRCMYRQLLWDTCIGIG